MRIHSDPRKFKILILSSILILFSLFSGLNNAYSCDDDALVCNDLWMHCVNVDWAGCQQICNNNFTPGTTGYADCHNSCTSTYGETAPNGCLAKYNACLGGCYWNITSTAGAGGNVTSTGAGGNNSTADCPLDSCGLYLPSINGGSQTYSMNPNWCLKTSAVDVDGTPQGAISNHIFHNDGTSTQNHNITANFVLNSFTVTPSWGEGGSLNPASAQTVNCNSRKSFTVQTSTGYHIVSVTGCGGSLVGISIRQV